MEGGPPADEVQRLARAIRFALVTLVLGMSIPALHAAFSIGSFGRLFADIFANMELPTITKIVIQARPAFWFLSVITPLGAVATLRMRDLVPSFYLLGALTLLASAQFIILYYALTAPLVQLIYAMRLPHGP